MNYIRNWGGVACVVLLLALGRSSIAAPPKYINPNHDDPFLPLAVHGEGIAVTMHDEAQDRFLLAKEIFNAAQVKQSRGQLAKIDPQALGKAHVAVLQMRRLAEQLAFLGEPAAAEFQRRAVIDHPTWSMAQTYVLSGPEGTVHLAKVRQMITNSANARTATLRRAEELAKKGKWEEAENTLYEILDKLESITIFLTPSELNAIYDPFSTIRSRVGSEMSAVRRETANQYFAKRIELLTPDLDALLAEIQQAAESLKAAPVVSIENAELDGPQTFAHFIGRWEKLNAAIQRLHGVHLAARSELIGMNTRTAGTATATQEPVHPVVVRYSERFTGEIATALAGLIAADAARAAPNEIPALYREYVRIAALPAARAANAIAGQRFAEALQQLAARSPEFAGEVRDYHLATDELLRWRRRTAEALAREQEKSHPQLTVPLHAATTSKADYQALFYEASPDYPIPKILAPTPTFLPIVCQQLLSEKVRVAAARGLQGGKSSVSTMHLRTYATYKSLPDVAVLVQAMDADLMVSEASPPLSLAASMAVETARAGDFEAVGGEITGLHLEGFVTRLAALPDVASPLMPLGSVPIITSTTSANAILSQAVVRCDLKPTWLQHRAFFVAQP